MSPKIQGKKKRSGEEYPAVDQEDYITRDKNINYLMDEVLKCFLKLWR